MDTKNPLDSITGNQTDLSSPTKADFDRFQDSQSAPEPLSVMVFELDQAGTILKAVGTAGTLTDLEPGFLTGLNWWETFFPGEYRLAAQEVESRWMQGDLNAVRLQALGSGGSVRTLEITTCLQNGKENHPTRVICFVNDVTSLLEGRLRMYHADQEQKQLQRIARIGSWTWDISSNHRTWSDELYHIYDLKPNGSPPTQETLDELNHPEDRKLVVDMLARSLSARVPVEFEHRVLHSSGDTHYLLERVEVVTAEDGKPLRMIGVVQDITRSKMAEISSHARDELLRVAVANAPLTLFVVDPNGRLLLSIGNSFSGADPSIDLPAHNIYNIFPPDSRIWEDIQQAQQGGSFTTITKINNKTYDVRYEPIKSGDGAPAGVLGVAIDITDRLHIEDKIFENENRFRQILESVQDYAIYMLGPDGTVTSWNTGAQAIKGYTEVEVIGSNFSRFFTEPDRERGKPQRLLKLALENGRYEEENWRVRKDGTLFWASILLTPIYDSAGNHIGFSKVVRDMTRRKTDEEQVRRQWNYIQLLQDIALAANEAVQVEDALRTALRRICDQTGWNIGHAFIIPEQQPREFVSLRTWYLSDPYRFEPFRAATENLTFTSGAGLPGRVLIQAEPVWIDDITTDPISLRKEAGEECGLKTGVAFPILVGKTIAGVLEFFSTENLAHDEEFTQIMSQIGTQLGRVIERNRSETALRQSEARFRTIFESAALGIMLVDMDAHIIESNTAAADMVGYTIQELRELTRQDPHHPANLIANVEFFRDLQANRRNSFRVERPYIRKDSRLAWSRISVSLMRDSSGNPQFAIGMIEDITEQRQMEAELIELQRSIMEAREGERLQLAQELHDGPVQDLYGISFQLKAASDTLTADSKNQSGDLQAMMMQVISKLRTICKDLRPPTLAPFGLEKAIRAHADAYMEENPIDIILDLQPDGQILPEKVRLALFRIYQQTAINILRHARATQMKVRFSFSEKEIMLEIHDNGEGFIVPDKWIELARQGHMGLIGAAERAEAIGGKLSIVSDPKSGTRVRVVAPRNNHGTKPSGG